DHREPSHPGFPRRQDHPGPGQGPRSQRPGTLPDTRRRPQHRPRPPCAPGAQRRAPLIQPQAGPRRAGLRPDGLPFTLDQPDPHRLGGERARGDPGGHRGARHHRRRGPRSQGGGTRHRRPLPHHQPDPGNRRGPAHQHGHLHPGTHAAALRRPHQPAVRAGIPHSGL
ncbi:regulatory proteins, AsnC/Lrp, partial [Arthrobacter sp. DR-2P]